jgi:hypothetical protein
MELTTIGQMRLELSFISAKHLWISVSKATTGIIDMSIMEWHESDLWTRAIGWMNPPSDPPLAHLGRVAPREFAAAPKLEITFIPQTGSLAWLRSNKGGRQSSNLPPQ